MRGIISGTLFVFVCSCASSSGPAGSSDEARVSVVGALQTIDAGCPPPTRADGPGRCVLDGDVTLDASLSFASFTTLNCRGRRLAPVDPGGTCAPGANCGTVPPSRPAAAIVLRRVEGVKIQNCDIRGFDFGVLVLRTGASDAGDGPTPPPGYSRNKLLSNTIVAKYRGIALVAASDTQISENHIIMAGGWGIEILRASRRNLVTRNTVEVLGRHLNEPLLPGVFANRAFPQVAIGSALGRGEGVLLNVVLGPGDIEQFPLTQELPADNLIEGNDLDAGAAPVAGTSSTFGIANFGAHRLTIRDNIIRKADFGLNLSADGSFLADTYPGTCSLDGSFYCLRDTDCQLGGVARGACSRTCGVGPGPSCATDDNCAPGTRCLLGERRPFEEFSEDNLVERNLLTGPYRFNAVLATNALRPRFEANQIGGAALNGIALGSRAAESASVTRNVVTGGISSLAFNTSGSAFFGARVFRNDFVGSAARRVTMSRDSGFAMELSDAGQGNFWGRTCDDHLGFQAGSTTFLNRVAFVSPSTAVAVGSSGAIFRSVDAGTSWSAATLPTSASLLGLTFVDADRGWAVGTGGTILATTDGGLTWSTQTSGTDAVLRAVHFSDASHGWVVGRRAISFEPTLLRTTDGGATWEPRGLGQPVGISAILNDVHFTSAASGWVVGSAGRPENPALTVAAVFATSDGGASWTPQALPADVRAPLFDVHFVDASSGWIVGGAGLLLHTSSGGEDPDGAGPLTGWARQIPGSPGLARNLLSVHFAGGTGWVVGEAGTVLRTTDGSTWTLQAAGGALPLDVVHAADSQPALALDVNRVIRSTSSGAWDAVLLAPTTPGDGPAEVVRDSHAYGAPVAGGAPLSPCQ